MEVPGAVCGFRRAVPCRSCPTSVLSPAQLAVCGELGVGARVQVWWDGDATFYSGMVAHYDAVSTE